MDLLGEEYAPPIIAPGAFGLFAISAAAREVFLDQGPKAPVAMVAKKLGVSTATLFQRTGSKQQLMLMALQPEARSKRRQRDDDELGQNLKAAPGGAARPGSLRLV